MSSSTPVSRSIVPLSHAQNVSRAQAAAILFGFLGIIFIGWPLWRISVPLEINRNEPWNAWFIDAVINGTPLYPGRDELIVNNYPPLSFYITALFAKLTGDTVIAGRAISVAAAIGVAIAAALCIRALGGSRPAAAFGGLWLFATLTRFFARYVGVNDPSLLGLALMAMALALFLHQVAKGRSILPAIGLMVVAGFTKQNMPAIPMAALLWLFMLEKRKGLGGAAFGIAFSAAALLICAAIYGSNFIEQMLTPREMSVAHMLSTLNKLQWVAPALVFWGIWAWQQQKEPAVRFTALLLGLSLISGLLQASGAGVTFNAHLETVFATAVAVGLAFEGIAGTSLARRLGPVAIQTTMIAVLVLRLLMSQQLEPYLVVASSAFREEIRQNVVAMDAEVNRIRAIPGAVSCSVMTICYRAGKAFVYDDFWVSQLLAKHRLSREDVEQAIKRRGIRFEEIDIGALRGKKRLF